jgi:hypothetical protein
MMHKVVSRHRRDCFARNDVIASEAISAMHHDFREFILLEDVEL